MEEEICDAVFRWQHNLLPDISGETSLKRNMVQIQVHNFNNLPQDYQENIHEKTIQLKFVTVKIPGQKPSGIKSVAEEGVEEREIEEAEDLPAFELNGNLQ